MKDLNSQSRRLSQNYQSDVKSEKKKEKNQK